MAIKQKKYKCVNGIIKREIAGRVLLVPQTRIADLGKNQEIFLLNSTSEYIWDILNETHSFDEIVSKILNKFKDVQKREAVADAQELIDTLIVKKLIIEL